MWEVVRGSRGGEANRTCPIAWSSVWLTCLLFTFATWFCLCQTHEHTLTSTNTQQLANVSYAQCKPCNVYKSLNVSARTDIVISVISVILVVVNWSSCRFGKVMSTNGSNLIELVTNWINLIVKYLVLLHLLNE